MQVLPFELLHLLFVSGSTRFLTCIVVLPDFPDFPDEDRFIIFFCSSSGTNSISQVARCSKTVFLQSGLVLEDVVKRSMATSVQKLICIPVGVLDGFLLAFNVSRSCI